MSGPASSDAPQVFAAEETRARVVTRENAVILLFMAAGLVLAYGGRVATGLSDTLLIGVLLLVGVVALQAVIGYLDAADSD